MREEIKQERRRRSSNLSGRRNRMGIDESKLDRVNYEYRFVNDEGTRLYDLTVNDDWDVVKDRSGTLKVDGTGVGTETAVPVGMGQHGAPVRAVLLRKPKHMYIDDKRAEQRLIDEQEAGLKAGATPGAGMGEQTYIPADRPILFENGSKA